MHGGIKQHHIPASYVTLLMCLIACNPDVTGWVYILVEEIRICVMRSLIREAAQPHTQTQKMWMP